MNRKRIVQRNHPVLTKVQPLSPLSVGNGEFAFSADFTGLQTFPESYDVPLGTQSNWGWHYTGGPDRYGDGDIAYQAFDAYGRTIQYAMKPEDKEDAYHWLRQNPHRLQLGRIAFRLLKDNGQEGPSKDTIPVRQELNLWEGIIRSEFRFEDVPVLVTTSCHPETDQIGVKVVSPLLREGRLQVFIRFPAPDVTANGWASATFPDWGNPDRHGTKLTRLSEREVLLSRSMDQDRYEVKWAWDAGEWKQTDTHEFTLYPARDRDELAFSAAFGQAAPMIQPADEIEEASRIHWESFWMHGGAIDFSGSEDSRASELERRVVLSQFLAAVHSGGSMPPQETGYMYNSWFGKFHLEMHWWHAAHFPLWGRAGILARSMDWYDSILPLARDLARSQGYEGARWPKMVGIDGKQSPSPVAPGLIWQQPHPIALCELCYKADPRPETLERYKAIVFESADFMASFAHWDESKHEYVLGPPLIPAQECHKVQDSLNPPYELEYWKYGLEIAAAWADRLQTPKNPKWAEVSSAMAAPPQQDGVYLAHANCPDTFTNKNHDHPSMLGALGILPGTMIDRETMRRTLLKVRDAWEWDSAWGWDFPMCAMTAARLGNGGLAVDFLLMEATKNTYLPNGHNYQRPGLSAYLPGNGGLLAAVAMMACGWDGAPDRPSPGFPQDGSWSVKWEGLKPWL
ncbi:glycoside hydrolase family 65 [Paenibacillus solisilvae]|uniref:Glycoside hydrolase family 65 n=1 Tax=Paenibacillus solisilvae TaxID=2486751 RepID=A0ABW0W0D8_9BACL